MVFFLQNFYVNIISLISQDRAIYFLQNGVLHFIIRHLVVEIDHLSQCCSKPPCSILNNYYYKALDEGWGWGYMLHANFQKQ